LKQLVIKIEEDLHSDFKSWCAKNKIKMKDKITDFIKDTIKEDKKE